MKKRVNIKDIIIIILIIVILGDFFFNDRILLTKFAELFTNITTKIGRWIGEEFSQIITNSVNK